MKASRSQLARIHIAAKDLGLDEVVYRQVLINETGKRSAGDLTYGQARTVIEYFEKCGWIGNAVQGPTSKVQGESRTGFASPRQIGMIRGLWADLSYAPKEKRDGALREFLWKRFRVSDLRFLSSEGASKVIVALQAMQGQGSRNKVQG